VLFVCVVSIGLISSVLRQEIGWEEWLQKDSILCRVGRKTLTRFNQRHSTSDYELINGNRKKNVTSNYSEVDEMLVIVELSPTRINTAVINPCFLDSQITRSIII